MSGATGSIRATGIMAVTGATAIIDPTVEPAAFLVTAQTVTDLFDATRSSAGVLRAQCMLFQSLAVAGTDPSPLLGILSGAVTFQSLLQSLTKDQRAAMSVRCQQEYGDATIDFSGQADAMVKALGAMISGIVADYPHDSAGNALDKTVDAKGVIKAVSVTDKELPNAMSAITGWLQTIQ